MRMLIASGTVILFLACQTVSGAEPKEDPKVSLAKVNIKNFETASKAFYIKNASFPEKLDELVNGNRPFIEGGEKALLDPWGNKYKYDAKGPKNDGKRPDIWTETPDKKVIGNWTKEKS